MLSNGERRHLASEIEFTRQLHANRHADQHRHARLLGEQAPKTITHRPGIPGRERRIERTRVILSAPPATRQRVHQNAMQPRRRERNEPLSIIKPPRLPQRLERRLKLGLRDVIAGH